MEGSPPDKTCHRGEIVRTRRETKSGLHSVCPEHPTTLKEDHVRRSSAEIPSVQPLIAHALLHVAWVRDMAFDVRETS